MTNNHYETIEKVRKAISKSLQAASEKDVTVSEKKLFSAIFAEFNLGSVSCNRIVINLVEQNLISRTKNGNDYDLFWIGEKDLFSKEVKK